MQGTGRRHIIIAGVTIGTCCAMPTLSMLQDGYPVYPVIDACGAWNAYEAQAAMMRMAQAGAQPVTTFALGCELQGDWKLPTANDMLAPFTNNLPECGFVLQNFWNNAARVNVAQHLPKRPEPTPGHTEAPAAEPGADPAAPAHDDWLLDESLEETFPASDPIAPARRTKPLAG